MAASQTTPRRLPAAIEPGQRWTFVHSSGKETEYVVVDPTDPEQMSDELRKSYWARWEPEQTPQSVAYLLNEATGKYAMVTHFWLRAAFGEGRSRWMPPVVA